MKDRLDQYTMAQFIDVACGDFSSIGAEPDNARSIAESLVEQYNNAADPVSAKARLLESERGSRYDAKIKLYRILLNLIHIYEAYDDVRTILETAGYSNIAKREDKSLKAKIEQMLRTEESNLERMKNERGENQRKDISEYDFRASFDRQTASLMAHFKFSICHDSISASVYANLVNMACRQQRQNRGK